MDLSTSTGRVTCNSQRATGISDMLLSIAWSTTAPPGASRPSPLLSDFSYIPEEEEPLNDNESEHSHHSRHSPDPHHSDTFDNAPEHPDNPDSDADEPNLAHSLRLLAKRIGDIAAPPPASRKVKPRTPDTFDGSNPNKLETFTFQVSMYIPACAKDFP